MATERETDKNSMALRQRWIEDNDEGVSIHYTGAVNFEKQFGRDPIFYRDRDFNAFIVFSRKDNGFFELSWFNADRAATQAEWVSIFAAAFLAADTAWGSIPFSFVYNQKIMSILGEDSGVNPHPAHADSIVLALNALNIGTAIRLIPPQDFSFDIDIGKLLFDGVYAHSRTLRYREVWR